MSWWTVTPAELSEIRSKYNVSVWPQPNSERVDVNFRFQWCDPNASAVADRWFCGVKYEADIELEFFAVVDLLAIGQSHLFGESGADADDRTIQVEVKEFPVSAPHPFFGFGGTSIDIGLARPGFDTSHVEKFFPFPAVVGSPILTGSITNLGGSLLGPWERVYDDGLNPTIPFPGFLRWKCNTVSSCWDLPGEATEFGVGFAEFNGVDAYVQLDVPLTSTNAPFIYELEFRLHTLHQYPFMGREAAGGFLGHALNNNLLFGNLNRPTTYVADVGVWHKWRLEFEQTGPLSYDLLVDDINVWSQVTNRQSIRFQNLGVFRHNTTGTQWADLDMRNLKIWSGAAPSTIVELDMPLIVNALDFGPNLNHGTTFNMDLPSV